MALQEASARKGVEVALVGRNSGWEALSGPAGRPVVVAVRNDDLEGVVEKVPGERRADLVFLQNGALRQWMHDRGLMTATRGILYLAVRERGGPIVDGGTSVFCGPHDHLMASWFGELGLGARTVDWAIFGARECEKLLWLSCFGILCELTGETVGGVAEKYQIILEELVRELQPVLRAAFGIEFPTDWMVARLMAYSMKIPDWRASVKEWSWRDGWFEAQARRFEIATPLHEELLKNIGKWPLGTPSGS